MDEVRESIYDWGFPVLVWVTGGALAIIHKKVERKISTVALSLITSCWVAYVIYALSAYLTDNIGIQVALAGLGSYMSVNTLVAFEEIIVRAIKKKMGIDDERRSA